MNSIFLQLGLIVLAGVSYRRLPGSLPASEIRRVISSIVLNIFIPLLTFGVMSRAPIGSDLLTVPIVSISSVLAGLVISWVFYAVFLRSTIAGPAIGSLILASTWCNAMYMGLPITTTIVGEHMSRVPIMFDYLGMTPLLFTVGTLISSRFGTAGEQGGLGRGLVQAMRMPPTLAIAAGLVVNLVGVPIPDWVIAACSAAGKVVAPLMLFSVGLALGMPSLKTVPLLIPSVVIRTVAVPALMLPLTRYLITDPDVFRSVMLEAAMPSMMLTMVFAERFGLDESVLAQAILTSTLFSILTLPYIAAWTP